MRLLIPILLAFASIAVRADTLGELKAYLGTVGGHGATSAEVEYDYHLRAGDKADTAEETCKLAVRIDDTEQGMRVHWRRATLESAAAEQAAKDVDPDRRTPTRRAMGALSAGVLAGYLNGAAELSRTLGIATLVEETATDWKGRPARMLTFKLSPKISKRDKKYLKELDVTFTVWVGEGGVPLAAERKLRMKGRAMMVISFETRETDEFEYAATGDRLVVTRHMRESNGSGAGESNTTRTVATLALIPGE